SGSGAFEVPRKTRTPGRVHILFSYQGSRLEARRILEQNGAVILRWVPESSYVVSVTDGSRFASHMTEQGSGGTASTLDASTKLSPAISPGQTDFVIDFHPDVDMSDARAIINETGLEIIENPDLIATQLVVHGEIETVTTLADWDEVAYIFPASDDLAQGLP